MEIVSNVALISINETLVVQLVSFLIFLFIINRIMFRPLRNTMAERDFYLEEMAADIGDAEKGYENALLKIESQESDARTAALALSREREADGNAEAGRIFETARAEIAELKIQAEAEVAATLAEARESVQASSEALAIAIMEKVLERRLAS